MTRNITRILVPTDFSETSDAALAYGKTLAERFGASLHLLHVFEDPYTMVTYAPEVYTPIAPNLRDVALRDAETQLANRLSAAEKARFNGTTEIVTGLTAKEIVQYAKDHAIDLIVMGTHGRRGVAHLLLGSVAEHVVRTAACPVLTVRGALTAASNRDAKAEVTAPLVACIEGDVADFTS
jgi:nucleotide-binding universal stress UspA family protein